MPKKILIVAGEPSGDLHGGSLAAAIKSVRPDIELYGVGGDKMQEAGVFLYQHIKGLSCFGFFDALLHIKRFINLQKKLLILVKQNPPDLIILIDFSGFNLRFAKKINNTIPIFYYISPQVWASRPGRLKTIKKYIKKMIVIFEFEKKIYQDAGIDAEFTGNPLLDIVKPALSCQEAKKEFGLKEESTIITLLPGSRKPVVKRHLPIMLKAAHLINKELKNCQFIIVKAPILKQNIFDNEFSEYRDMNIKIIENRNYDCINSADFVITSSGTATLETAIMQKPMLIIYKMGLLSYLLYKPLVKLPFIGMVNIVAGKKIIPELIQFKVTAENIAKQTLEILSSKERINQIKENLALIKLALGSPGACLRAAEIICSV